MLKKLLAAVVVVALVAVGAWLVLRPASYADRDWSAVTTPQRPRPPLWTPSTQQVAALDALDLCALHRAVYPHVEKAEQHGEVCQSWPERDDLEVERVADQRVVETQAYESTATEVAGVEGWLSRPGRCLLFLPAGQTHGLLVSSDLAPVCDDLSGRVARALTKVAGDPLRLGLTPYGEPTIRGTGDCVDLYRQWERRCQEHTPRDVPDDPVDAIREGEADPDIVCSAALAAMDDAAPEVEVRAVTTQRSCELLIGERESGVSIRTTREKFSSESETTLAGHLVYENPQGAPVYTIALGEQQERGTLEVDFVTAEAWSYETDPMHEPEWARPFMEALVTDLLE